MPARHRHKSQPVPVWGWWIIGSLLCLIAAALVIASGILPGIYQTTADLVTISKAVAILLLVVVVYLVPAIIARGTPRFAAILVANLAFGWTIIGWLVVLIWALAEQGSLNKNRTP